MLTAKKIIKAIGNPYLNLYRGKGYQYFTYYDGSYYEDYSVYINRINDYSLDQWVAEGKDFLNKIKTEKY
ncbi:MAG: hypothetical protein CMB25_08080 [Euryarchaeota archaeon]|nr:hypothetical protein [Euryarchaeota archaeon]|tara:strand:+ start:6408 stop:6617 length:210 start_codon:yes stop_codon:yes gene_type:complete